MGSGMDGIQYTYYLKSIATCDHCGTQFQVSADFWTEKKYWEGKIVEEMHTGAWTPIYDNQTVETTKTVKKLSIITTKQ